MLLCYPGPGLWTDLPDFAAVAAVAAVLPLLLLLPRLCCCLQGYLA
jgi:hypothetical protein